MTRRPVTMFTGQWADVPLEQLAKDCGSHSDCGGKCMGFDGLELACWGDHFQIPLALTELNYCDAQRKKLAKHGLGVWAISNHLVGQATLDPVDERHQAILPPEIWGDGNPAGVRERAVKNMKDAALAAKRLGVSVVNGFTGSPIWQYIYSFPPVTEKMIEDGYRLLREVWMPILDEFGRNGVRFALEVHPTEIAFDTYSAERTLDALDHHDCFGFNFDPSHLAYQGVDYVGFIRRFRERIFHVHMKDVWWGQGDGSIGVFGGHSNFGDPRRYWDFRSLGRGDVNFQRIIVALNEAGYQGPLSVEWEDSRMDRMHGANEACKFVRKVDFPASGRAFDKAFDTEEQPTAAAE